MLPCVTVLPCVTMCYPVFPGKYYMLAHHIVVQHKLNEQCVQRLVSSTRFSKLLCSVLSTPRLSFVSFYVLLCTYSSSSVITSPFLSLLVLLGPYQSFYVLTSLLVSLLVLFRPFMSSLVHVCPYQSFCVLTSPFPSLLVLFCPY